MTDIIGADDSGKADDILAEAPAGLKAEIISVLPHREHRELPATLILSLSVNPWRRMFTEYLADRCLNRGLEPSIMNMNRFLDRVVAEDPYDIIRDGFAPKGKYPIYRNNFIKSLYDEKTYKEDEQTLIKAALTEVEPEYDKFVKLVALIAESTSSSTATTSTRTDSGTNLEFLGKLNNNTFAYGHLIHRRDRQGAPSCRLYIDGDKAESPGTITFPILKKKGSFKLTFIINERDLPEEKDREFVRKTFREFTTPQSLEFVK